MIAQTAAPFASFLVFYSVVIIANVVWAVRDARRNRYRPLICGCTVAAIAVGLIVSLFVYWTIARTMAAGSYDVFFDWGSILFMLALVFTITAFVGWLSYLIMHFFANKGMIDPSSGAEEPEVRMEETGNPYQPPST